MPIPSRFCWSKVGTESGETLDRILIRKEFERLANGGYFLWGVGNSVLNAVEGLFRFETRPRIIFSRMKSKPKAVDVRPSVVYAWIGAEAADGTPCEIPAFSLITSRGETETVGRKRSHFALVCYSSEPLTGGQAWQNALDAASFVNLLSGRPLGASQVTSVVERNEHAQGAHLRSRYSVDFTAELTPPGQFRLVEPIALNRVLMTALEDTISRRDYEGWKMVVRKIRSIESKNIASLRDHLVQRDLALG